MKIATASLTQFSRQALAGTELPVKQMLAVRGEYIVQEDQLSRSQSSPAREL